MLPSFKRFREWENALENGRDMEGLNTFLWAWSYVMVKNHLQGKLKIPLGPTTKTPLGKSNKNYTENYTWRMNQPPNLHHIMAPISTSFPIVLLGKGEILCFRILIDFFCCRSRWACSFCYSLWKAGFQDPGSSIFKGILFRVGGESEIDPGPNGFSDGGQIHTDEYS